MKDRINKPRVFLSHSKKDVAFVQRLSEDLRKCQIDPWLDDYEIRHGQPWLDAIFEDGLPTCDAVLVYLSECSIASPVVRKEIDAGIVQKLRDNQVAFLPYVTAASLRSRLRADLQTIQTPEWNEANYGELLPRVVAEVWRSYLERVVVQATQRERVARLEAELRVQELEKQQDADGFSTSESHDFEYIWTKVDRFEPVVFVQKKGKGKAVCDVARYTGGVHVGSLLPGLSDSTRFIYSPYDINYLAKRAAASSLPGKDSLPSDEILETSIAPDIGDELLRYGFLARVAIGETTSAGGGVVNHGHSYQLMFTEKLERFKYWLDRKGKLATSVQCRVAPAVPDPLGPAA